MLSFTKASANRAYFQMDPVVTSGSTSGGQFQAQYRTTYPFRVLWYGDCTFSIPEDAKRNSLKHVIKCIMLPIWFIGLTTF